jgi:membrane carboxypeptidase/penicillin-binding protein PbpC
LLRTLHYGVYLNSIEMGPEIYGAERLSQYWFKKSATSLSKYRDRQLLNFTNQYDIKANRIGTLLKVARRGLLNK